MAHHIFVSYARVDDQDKAIQKFVEMFITKARQYTGSDINVFMDFNMEVGQAWKPELQREAENSLLLMAFLSPSYFKSQYCLDEWDHFYDRRKKNSVDIILPVEFVPLKDPEHKFDLAERLDEEQKLRLDQARRLHFLTWSAVKFDPIRSEKLIQQFCHDACNKIMHVGHIDPTITNVHVICKDIDFIADEEAWNQVYDKIRSRKLAFNDSKPVCVIYTGGTVGMVREDEKNRDSKLVIGGVDELRRRITKLRELEFDIDFYSYREPLDSSNIDSDDWVKLANIVKALYSKYQGFVILHGTNTMSFTASAVSFFFDDLTKPVILTGAELPLIELNSDAEPNVIRAIQCAASETSRGPGNIPEVCVLFGNTLLRGNRSTKKHSLNIAEGFYSPNHPPLGNIDHNRISLNHRVIRKVRYGIENRDKLDVRSEVEKRGVFILQVYPDMDLDHVRAVFSDSKLRGVVLRTYGSGNAPDIPPDFINLVEQLISRYVVVVNLTQCPEGYAELRLFETNARLFDIGVINGGDMTLEAAYCKLKYLLGRHRNMDRQYSYDIIKQEMVKDIRGELTLSAFSMKYLRRDDNTRADPVFHGVARTISHFRFDPSDIDHAFLRIQGIQLESSTDRLHVKFYYNRGSVGLTESEDDKYYRIGSFDRNIEGESVVSQNLEVTDRIRRLVREGEDFATMEVVSVDNLTFAFESLELTIFTKGR